MTEQPAQDEGREENELKRANSKMTKTLIRYFLFIKLAIKSTETFEWHWKMENTE